MAREDLHFRLRIPEDLKSRVEMAAAENRRSMTAEIVARLEASFGNSELDEYLAARLADRDKATAKEIAKLRDEFALVRQYFEQPKDS